MENEEKKWATDEDIEEAWNYAMGADWNSKNGYYTQTFNEWLTEYKKSKQKSNEEEKWIRPNVDTGKECTNGSWNME